jgi:hypothetical protein
MMVYFDDRFAYAVTARKMAEVPLVFHVSTSLFENGRPLRPVRQNVGRLLSLYYISCSPVLQTAHRQEEMNLLKPESPLILSLNNRFIYERSRNARSYLRDITAI